MAKENSRNPSQASKQTSKPSSKTSPLPEAVTPTPLTPKEKAVLEFIELQMVSSGVSPSYQEIKDHFSLASFNSVQNYLKQLTNKGYIEIPAHQKRAIRLLRSANAVQEDLLRRSSHLSNQIPKGESSRVSLLQARGEALSLPLLGRVAAGRPIERFSNDEFIEVPPLLVKKPASTFVLQVEGDSMIDDGIWDGDYLLVEKKDAANNGDIIVASVDNEATVKRIYLRPRPDMGHESPMVELRPSNPRLKSMWFHPEEVSIKGMVVGLIRKYDSR